MGKRDPRVDAYIEKSATFARPILRHLREIVHAACPAAEETMKWSFPHFDYKGMLCSMAAFSGHCAFGFWKGSLVLGDKAQRNAMGHLGRITSLDDLPSDATLKAYVKKAARLNDEGVKAPRVVRPRAPLRTPPEFLAAVKRNRKAHAAFVALSPSHKREYVEWIVEAKGEATRKRRMETAIAWMAEGKPRNWKYAR